MISNFVPRKCLLCGHADRTAVLFRLSRLVLRCGNCGLVFSDPCDTVASQTDYAESYYRGGVYSDYFTDRRAIRMNAFSRLARFEKLVTGRALLDVGCATGYFLEAARDRGWFVQGLEVSEFAANYARKELGLPVKLGSITSVESGLQKYDIVTLWDTIEHLDRPDLGLENIRGLLHPTGVLALSTGDLASFLSRVAGDKWRLFGDPTHNYFFTEVTLKELLFKAGFQVFHTSREGKWVSLQMVLHQSGLPPARRIRDWFHRLNFNPPLYLNLWDVMTVFAKPLA